MGEGLLGKMLAPEPQLQEVSPEEVPENHEDLIVFFSDFENSKLSATQRLAALSELIKSIK